MEEEEGFLDRRLPEVLYSHRDYSVLHFHLWWLTAGYHCNESECAYVCV